MKPRSKSEWMTPAACGAVSPAWIVHARDFLLARREIRAQAEQMIRCADQRADAAIRRRRGLQKLLRVLGAEDRRVALDLRADRRRLRRARCVFAYFAPRLRGRRFSRRSRDRCPRRRCTRKASAWRSAAKSRRDRRLSLRRGVSRLQRDRGLAGVQMRARVFGDRDFALALPCRRACACASASVARFCTAVEIGQTSSVVMTSMSGRDRRRRRRG